VQSFWLYIRPVFLYYLIIDMTAMRPVLNMHNHVKPIEGYTCIPTNKYMWTWMTIVSFVFQSGQVSEGRAISVLHHVN